MKKKSVLENFPKQRKTLPQEHKKIYKDEYIKNRLGKGFASKISQYLESWMHKQVAASAFDGNSILELGCGTLNQLPYECAKAKFSKYDVVEPMPYLFKESANKNYLSANYKSIEEVDGEKIYDRIISIAVMEHITNLPETIAQAIQLLKDNGRFVAAFPSEGGLLWGLAWRLGTGLSYRIRTGLSYKALIEHEHVNNADEILACLRYFFGELTVQYFPIRLKHMSLYITATCEKPITKHAEFILKKINN